MRRSSPSVARRLTALTASLAVAGAAGLLTTYAAGPGTPVEPTAAHPAAATKARPASVTTLAVPAPTAAQPDTAARSTTSTTRTSEVAERTTKRFGMLGVTWARGTGTSGVTVRVRTRSGGTWSAWRGVDVDTEDDGGGAGTRAGTEPLWVGSADGVAARVTSARGATPQDVQVDLVDPGTDPAGATSERAAAATTGSGPRGYTPVPALVTRAQWGARANTPCDSPRYGSRTLGAVVHHTAGSNSYTRSQSAAVVRGIQAFHMSGRGWCDIGYDFLVDKYGTTYEGRSGGVLYQVRGAHAGNFTVNTYAMGVSMMGNLDTVAPTTAEKAAVVRLIGWRLGTNYVSPGGSYRVDGHTLNRISGHRDVYSSGIRPATSTACPGRYGYAWLTSTASTGLRQQVAAYVAGYDTRISERASYLGRDVTGPVYVGEAPIPGTSGYKTRFSRGDIFYLDDDTGAHLVSGAVKTEYQAVGGATGDLGFPTSDLNTSDDIRAQRFEHGTVYQVGTRAYAESEGVDAKYRELDKSAGPLGAPTARVLRMSNGTDRSTFAHGTIRYHRADGTSTVTYD